MKKFPGYLQAISQSNNLGNGLNVQWVFHCGMLFSSMDKWWGDFKFRHSTHEGIDITYYRTDSDTLYCFDRSIKIPAMEDGIILNICDDFLGKTLVIEHEKSTLFNRRILFIYAHIIPEMGLNKGHIIKKNDIIARVCHTDKNPQLPPHLHFSCFEVDQQIKSEYLNWNLFSKGLSINMIHPVFL